MSRALYGDRGFFRSGPGPAGHFRTSAHASPLFAGAIGRLLSTLDELLGRPERLDVVDMGAGRGELLRALASLVPNELRSRLRLAAVELAPAPEDLPPSIKWLTEPPPGVTGLVLATEWLDNVPLDVVELDGAGTPRYVHVDGSLGGPVETADADWLRDWWPLRQGSRAEVGRPRDEAWAGLLSTVETGFALCVDYGHLADARPEFGTLTGYRDGREALPVPDGTVDLTAHVAMDAVAARGEAVAGAPSVLVTQREALRALGVDGRRPSRELASRDPAGYVRALAAASAAAELTEPAGLGAHFWLLQPVACEA